MRDQQYNWKIEHPILDPIEEPEPYRPFAELSCKDVPIELQRERLAAFVALKKEEGTW